MDNTILKGLTPVQAQVALTLASGASISSAAQCAGVSCTTIYSWRQHDASFAAAVEQAKAEYVLTLRDQLRDASAKALAIITAILDDQKASASVRLKAALAILNRPQFPDPGWTLPERIGSPNQEQALDHLAGLEFAQREMRAASAQKSAPGTERNNSEQDFANSHPTHSPDQTRPMRTKLNTSEHKNGLFEPRRTLAQWLRSQIQALLSQTPPTAGQHQA